MASAVKRSRGYTYYYQAAWEEEYFVVPFGDTCKCLVCAYVFGNNRKQILQSHFDSLHAELNTNFARHSPARKHEIESLKSELRNIAPLDITNVVSSNALTTTRLSYKVAFILAKAMKPYEDGAIAKKLMIEMANELLVDGEVTTSLLEKVEKTPLSSRTITRRVQAIATDINDQLTKDLEECAWFSLQLDESTDVADTAQVSVFIRMVFNDFSSVEELLSVIPLQERTTGKDIFTALKENLSRKNVPLRKLVSITTDGAPAMIGRQVGLVTLCKEDPDIPSTILNSHCIIHQQALCLKSIDMSHVINPVFEIVNSIRARSLQHRLFQSLLTETGSDCNDLILHSEVRWLIVSRGKVLERFHEALPEIREFFKSRGENIQQLHDESWLADLAFFTDLLKRMNRLNLLLQGKNIPIWTAVDYILKFRRELLVWMDFSQKNTVSPQFENLTKMQGDLGAENDFCQDKFTREFTSHLKNLADQFQQHFQHFEDIHKIHNYFTHPLRTENAHSVAEIITKLFPALNVMAIVEEIGSLAVNRKYNFILGNNTGMDIHEFWQMVDQTEYINLTDVYKRLFSCFGSSYLCESMFSSMKHIKSKLRSRLTNENLESLLKISSSSYEPDFNKLAENIETTSQLQ